MTVLIKIDIRIEKAIRRKLTVMMFLKRIKALIFFQEKKQADNNQKKNVNFH